MSVNDELGDKKRLNQIDLDNIQIKPDKILLDRHLIKLDNVRQDTLRKDEIEET